MLQTRPRSRTRDTKPSVAHADERFGKYRKEDHKLVRQADVSVDLPRDLRERREMLRRMDPEQALAVIEFYRDLDSFQVLELAKRTGRLIVPDDVHARILAEVDEDDAAYLRQLDQLYPVRTGTLVIYEAPIEPFKRFVEFEGITFEVPKQFQGKRNCVLAIDYPDWDLIGHELVVPDPSHISLIPKSDVEGLPNTATYIGLLTCNVGNLFLRYGSSGIVDALLTKVMWSHASGVALF